MRAEAPVKEEKPPVTHSPKLSRKFSSSRKKGENFFDNTKSFLLFTLYSSKKHSKSFSEKHFDFFLLKFFKLTSHCYIFELKLVILTILTIPKIFIPFLRGSSPKCWFQNVFFFSSILDQPKVVKKEEEVSSEKAQQYEDDALLLSLIDSYCISSKMRHKVTSGLSVFHIFSQVELFLGENSITLLFTPFVVMGHCFSGGGGFF